MSNAVEKRLEQSKGVKLKPIMAHKKHNTYEYYYRHGDERTYIKKAEHATVKQILQKEYDLSAKKILDHIAHELRQFLDSYDFQCIDAIYSKLPDGKKLLVNPIRLQSDEYIQRWKHNHPGGQNPFENDGPYETANGETVRSKSEKILADLFLKYEIPYSYEPSLNLGNGYTVYPDFALLNPRTRKTYYWEHLGLITDPSYLLKNIQKLVAYDAAGFVIGENLLISVEGGNIKFDPKNIEKKIKKYLT